MNIPIQISYTYNESNTQLVFDLHKEEDRQRVIRTLIWASNKRVACVIQPMILQTAEGGQAA